MRYTFLFILLIGSVLLEAQSLQKGGDEEVGLRRTRDLSFGFRMNTNGWGLFGQTSRFVSLNKTKFWQFEFSEIKDPAEYKQPSDYQGQTTQDYTPRAFIYGKQNNFYTLRALYGEQWLLGEKAERGGVEVSWVYAFGPVLGLIKPYYLDIIVERVGDISYFETFKYTPENEALFLNRNNIVGSSGFGEGLDELRFTAGIHANMGFHFDWANYPDWVKALEVGFSAEVFPKKIPIMVSDRNKNYFLALYLSLQLGRRW